ncbi:MAG: GMC family oxidoreductase [Myxococcales bacterium]
MLTDARLLPRSTALNADICLIGAGPAGLTLAAKLHGLRVVLLESGGLYPAQDTAALAEGEIRGEPYWALETSRLRCLGGTSTHWTGWCRPLDAEVFAARDWVPNSGWPLTLDELVPYYREAQRICGLGELDYDPQRWAKRLGFPLLPLEGTAATTSLWQLSAPVRFGEKYKEQIASSPDLDAYLNATAVELSTTARGERVEEVRAMTLNGNELRVRARAFVLATGGIDNARLLLASQAPRGVGNASGLVGRFFMEHPHVVLGTLLCPKTDALRVYEAAFPVPGAAPAALRATLSVLPEVKRRERLLDCSVGLEPVVDSEPTALPQAVGALNLARKFQGIEAEQCFELAGRAEQLPSLDSYLRLSDDRDALGMPKTALFWKHDPRTLASLRRTVELLAEALARARLGRVYSYLHGGATRPGAWPEIFGGFHHMGTTRMHEDRKRGVVNRDCRVHSVENLFIAGSSVFPSTGSANPTLTVVALAARLADTLRRSFA